MNETLAAGRFLVAAPTMEDPVFGRPVVFLIGYEKETGSLGVIINRESNITLARACKQYQFSCTADGSRRLGWGGPVATSRGFIIHSPAVTGDPVIFESDTVAVGSSIEMLRDIAVGKGPEKSWITLGCAGWTPGQLEKEIQEGAWLLAPWCARTVFELPIGERYEAALATVGLEIDVFADVPAAFRMTGVGHA